MSVFLCTNVKSALDMCSRPKACPHEGCASQYKCKSLLSLSQSAFHWLAAVASPTVCSLTNWLLLQLWLTACLHLWSGADAPPSSLPGSAAQPLHCEGVLTHPGYPLPTSFFCGVCMLRVVSLTLSKKLACWHSVNRLSSSLGFFQSWSSNHDHVLSVAVVASTALRMSAIMCACDGC